MDSFENSYFEHVHLANVCYYDRQSFWQQFYIMLDCVCTHIPVGVTPDVGYNDAVLVSPLVSVNSVHLHMVLC